MKTIHMTIDDSLLNEVDQLIDSLNTSRSEFIHDALQLALQRHAILKLESQQQEGYKKHPVIPDEFDSWESEQVWERQ